MAGLKRLSFVFVAGDEGELGLVPKPAAEDGHQQ